MVKKTSNNIKLASYEDIFKTEETRNDEKLEKVQNISLSELYPFKNHPFKVIDDDSMMKTVESVMQYGVLTPAIARPRAEGGYELISGHRRHHASELAGLDTMPVIVRNLDDDASVILMVDSNLQRETILPSERAFAYKMKLEAIKHQGERSDLTSTQVVSKLSANKVGEAQGVSRETVRRFIRLTELIPELLKMVDDKKIAFNPAVELSYLKKEEQQDFLEVMDMEQSAPSLSQAQRLKKLSQDGLCTIETMKEIMAELKKDEIGTISFKNEDLKKFFPKSYTPKQMQDTIFKLLEGWQKKRQKQTER